MAAAGSFRTQPHCLISKMSVGINMWRISHLIIKWLFLSAWNPLRSQFISLRIIHTGFTVVDGQQVVYYLFLSWRIRNLSSSHADLLGAPLRRRHRARSASRLVVNQENSGDDEGRCSVWATLVHYRLRGGERGIHMTVWVVSWTHRAV